VDPKIELSMKKIIFVLTAILITIHMQAQQSSFFKINFSEIQKAVSSEESGFYFPVLFNRYLNADTTLSMEEFRYLYYGYTYQENYQPYKRMEAENIIQELILKDTLTSSDFSLIYNHCLAILQQHPFSTRYLLTAAIACTQSGNPEDSRNYYYKYDRIISTIMSSGDGATEQSAWSVILISDEAELISALGFQRTGQQKMLGKSLCDFVYVANNEYGIDGFYFDISRLFYGAGINK
jgi:hypothetical protein